MLRFAIVGKNIGYSLSPKIHNEHFLKLKYDACYDLLDIDNLCDFLPLLRQYKGFNVTVPYKEEIFRHCEVCGEEANLLKTVNCVAVNKKKFYGYNTDVYGFYKLLEKINLLTKNNMAVMIIGAGGAAKAVHYCFRKYTKYDIYVTNRTKTKAYALTNRVLSSEDAGNHLSDFDIVVNCTSTANPVEINKIKKGAWFIDINYHEKSLFLEQAEIRGAKTIGGLDMLVCQAEKSFEIWFNKAPDLAVMFGSVRKEEKYVNR